MKLFIILPRFPYPIEKGDKLRAFHQIRHLAKNNEIHLFCITDIRLRQQDINALKPYCKGIHTFYTSKISILFNIILAFFKGKPLQTGYFYNHRAAKKLKLLIEAVQPEHIYCQLIRAAEYVKGLPYTKTLDYQDVFSKGVERRIHKAAFYLKPVYRMEYKRLLKYEKYIFDCFDNKTIISIPDRDLIPHPEKEKIVIIPNGVDHDFFKPMDEEKRYDVVFTGNMGYAPNVNAAEFLANDIMPLVWESFPDAVLCLAGASPHSRVKALAGERITVTGWVDDIRPYYAGSVIFIAPMRIGTGLQNKLLEAMSMKLPCITSSLANNALKASADNDILIGETAEDFAQHIVHLLKNKKAAAMLAENGYNFVHQQYSWKENTKKLESLMASK
jgi:sugar transferase (PEP-CTERM/EpsH1 system associated)